MTFSSKCVAALAVATASFCPTASAEDWSSGWSGFYTGETLGVSSAGTTIERGAGAGDLELSRGGVSLGVVGGYNFTRRIGSGSGGIVWGVELDASSLPGKKSVSDAVLGNVDVDANFVATARLRGGYAWERTFVYATGGLALSDVSVKAGGRDSDQLTAGLALGLGAEYRMTTDWTARAEAMLTGFGEDDISVGGQNRSVAKGAAAFRLGVTRRF